MGLIILSANHILYVARLRDSQGTKRPLEGEVLVLLGWIIWKEGFAALKEMGVAEIFVPRNAAAGHSGIRPQANLY